MFGLSPDTDLNFFVGRTLIQICIGENDLILNFSENVSISMMSSIRLTTPKLANNIFEDFKIASSAIVKLLGQSIKHAAGTSEGTLTLEFNDGDCLTIFDDSKQYESYTIRHNDQLIVV